MRAEQEKLYSQLNGMNEEEKNLLIRRLLEEHSEMEARLEIANSAAAELAVQFQQIKDENAALKKDKKELIRQNRNLTDQLQKRKKDLFGRKSEQSSGIIDSIYDEDPEDPIDESSSEPIEPEDKTVESQRAAAAQRSRAPHRPATSSCRPPAPSTRSRATSSAT